ncbi:MAG: bifunctional homocysteine S-methyltransferase/methylenetetrahydrofolate reductase [Anaerolineales bacterium]|nr:bifunctional homocysteine S-methyltransferase/methylenetetrahydrofolate reductase [Anaerolineales bacterium]
MPTFLDRLAHGPLLADGAMGTMLHARGVALDHSFDALNLARPAVVADVHRAYIEAGADLIVTNTFGANRYKLAPAGLGERVAEVNAAAVALARQVVAGSGRPVLIAGDVGPLGVRLAPFGRVKPEQAVAAFHEQISALAAAGVDVILIETMSDLYEVKAAAEAARAVGGLPVITTMTFTRDDRTLLGDGPAQVGRELARLGADVIGVNCSGGPAQVLRLLRALRQVAPRACFLVKPNAGWPEHVGGRIMYPATPEYFGEYATAFVEAGAGLVGGCCGTTPAHIAAMRRALDTAPRPAASALAEVVEAERREDAAAPDQPTRLAQQLAAGRFVVGVEMDPPHGFNPHKLLAGAHLLAEAGADVINVADAPMARMRMSAWAAAHLIQREVGLETVLHFPTRGRNLLRVQGDLLAAHALAVRNVFVVMGDPAAIGDYPTANDNFDVVPSGLIKLIKQRFNAGLDAAGAAIGQPTSFLVGCAVNLAAADPAKELRTLHKKIAAGADFGLTQPVYDAALARAFITRYTAEYGPLRLPLLVGVLPLFNARHAAFLHNEVPGIVIPEALRARLAAAGEGPAAAAEGVALAVELLTELRGLVQGVYLMPPFGRYDLAAEILDRVRVKA